MGKTLVKIAEQLRDANKKVQLIYAFNGTGKTRLSRAFNALMHPVTEPEEDGSYGLSRKKVLYYNALTEDLFYWDNDLPNGVEPKLKIQPNRFTDWVFVDQGQDRNVITTFQRYANNRLTPRFNEERRYTGEDGREIAVEAYSEVTFSLERGDDQDSPCLKISKGQESLFVWSIFVSVLGLAIAALNEVELESRDTDQFDELTHVFIDDPVSSLDDNHLMELAVSLALLIKASPSSLKFIIATHNALFYNVLHNELDLKRQGKKEGCYLLNSFEDGSFELSVKYGDSNRSFSYHLYLRQILEEAVATGGVQRFHFMLLRNLYEKTASFLGYKEWKDLLPAPKEAYFNRIIQFTSHSTLSGETVTEPSGPEKNTLALLLRHLIDNYHFWQEVASPAAIITEN
jgi:hypothetical protein